MLQKRAQQLTRLARSILRMADHRRPISDDVPDEDDPVVKRIIHANLDGSDAQPAKIMRRPPVRAHTARRPAAPTTRPAAPTTNVVAMLQQMVADYHSAAIRTGVG